MILALETAMLKQCMHPSSVVSHHGHSCANVLQARSYPSTRRRQEPVLIGSIKPSYTDASSPRSGSVRARDSSSCNGLRPDFTLAHEQSDQGQEKDVDSLMHQVG